jgi:magnesium-transporting ATPase (P-type)
VITAVADCERGRIQVRMVTGDKKETAKAIAKQCGIFKEDRKYYKWQPATRKDSQGRSTHYLPANSGDDAFEAERGDLIMEGEELRRKILKGYKEALIAHEKERLEKALSDAGLAGVHQCSPARRTVCV